MGARLCCGGAPRLGTERMLPQGVAFLEYLCATKCSDKPNSFLQLQILAINMRLLQFVW